MFLNDLNIPVNWHQELCDNMLLDLFVVYIILIPTEFYTILIHTSEMTSLSEGIKRSEMVCMLAVPAKMTCIELMQFVAPSE